MAEPVHLDASAREAAFAANRASGRIELAVVDAAAGSRRARVHEAGALRVRFPRVHDDRALEAAIVNTAGGMAGGDKFEVDLSVGAGAALTVTSVAAEKIYRSLGATAQITVKADVEGGASLVWLPQETILFDRSRLQRSIEIELARDARLVMVEAVLFGRSAMGETLTSGYFFDRRRVRIGGRLVFAETIRLDGGIAERLGQPAVAGGGVAAAGIVKIPGGDDDVAGVRAIRQDFVGEVAVSAWNGLAVVRLVAADGAGLRRDLICALTALGVAPLPRLWLN